MKRFISGGVRPALMLQLQARRDHARRRRGRPSQGLDVGIDPGDGMAQLFAPRVDRTRDIAGVAAQRCVGEEDAHGTL